MYSRETNTLLQGPLPKSIYTYQLEEITRHLLKGLPFEIRRKGKNTNRAYEQSSWIDDPDVYDYDILIENKVYNLTNIVNYANLDHIDFNEDDFSLYSDYLQSADCPRKPEDRIKENEVELRHRLYKGQKQEPDPPVLHLQEMQALNIYSQQKYYIKINAFLRRQWNHESNKETKSVIIQSLMCASALRKLPEVIIQDVYRGITLEPESKELKEYIHAAEKNEIITLTGFISTTTNKSHDFLGKNTNFHFTELKGMYISPISNAASEDEFLILPTQVQLTVHQFDGKKHQFKGRLVSDLAKIEPAALEMPDTSAAPGMNNPQSPQSPSIPSSARLNLYGGSKYLAKPVSTLREKLLNMPSSIIEVDLRGNQLHCKSFEELTQLISAIPETVTSLAFFDDFLSREMLLTVIKTQQEEPQIKAFAEINEACNVLKQKEAEKGMAEKDYANASSDYTCKKRALQPITRFQKFIDFITTILNFFRTTPQLTYHQQYLLKEQEVNQALNIKKNAENKAESAAQTCKKIKGEINEMEQRLAKNITKVENHFKRAKNTANTSSEAMNTSCTEPRNTKYDPKTILHQSENSYRLFQKAADKVDDPTNNPNYSP